MEHACSHNPSHSHKHNQELKENFAKVRKTKNPNLQNFSNYVQENSYNATKMYLMFKRTNTSLSKPKPKPLFPPPKAYSLIGICLLIHNFS